MKKYTKPSGTFLDIMNKKHKKSSYKLLCHFFNGYTDKNRICRIHSGNELIHRSFILRPTAGRYPDLSSPLLYVFSDHPNDICTVAPYHSDGFVPDFHRIPF